MTIQQQIIAGTSDSYTREWWEDKEWIRIINYLIDLGNSTEEVINIMNGL